MTKMQNLQQQLDASNQSVDKQARLLSIMQHGSDQLATSLLHRLRMGESVDALIESAESTRREQAALDQYVLPTLTIMLS